MKNREPHIEWDLAMTALLAAAALAAGALVMVRAFHMAIGSGFHLPKLL